MLCVKSAFNFDVAVAVNQIISDFIRERAASDLDFTLLKYFEVPLCPLC